METHNKFINMKQDFWMGKVKIDRPCFRLRQIRGRPVDYEQNEGVCALQWRGFRDVPHPIQVRKDVVLSVQDLRE
mgnify:CR=1 FL=1